MSLKYKPMLAAPMKKGVITDWTQWVAERKWDGQRFLVEVEHGKSVHLYARPRSDGRQLDRSEKLAPALLTELKKFPTGWYDGELLGGDISTDVVRKDLVNQLWFVMFDLLEVEGLQWTGQFYNVRRKGLVELFRRVKPNSKLVQLTDSVPLSNSKQLAEFVDDIWNKGGEGVVVKHVNSVYYSGLRAGQKRTPIHWIKIKKVVHDALTVVGFEPSRGEVMGRGPFAIVKLRDNEGNETTCKTLNDEELAKFNKQWTKKYGDLAYTPDLVHPAIGRLLQIEHYGRTRDGGYRGPVKWDRWEDE
jgi:ATP-dependent DNA ligase